MRFLGFETMVTGELWNVDLWFFDRDTIMNAEAYCDNIIMHTTQLQKDAIIKIKNDLIAKGLYLMISLKTLMYIVLLWSTM